MKAYKVHFIRHGQTVANLEKRFAGHTDVPLSDTGRQMLETLLLTREYPNVGKVYASPLSRCMDTAELIYPYHKPVPVPGLMELNFGAFENKTMEELEQENPAAVLEWISNEAAPPGGESNQMFLDRVKEAFSELVEQIFQGGETEVAVVTHGGVIMALMQQFGLPEGTLTDWMTDNGYGYSVLISPSFWMKQKKFEVIHLIPFEQEEEEEMIP